MRAYPGLRRVVTLAFIAALMGAVWAPSAVAKGFKLGVAASEVTRSSAILWTRADQPGDVVLKLATGRSRAALSGPLTVFNAFASSANDNTVQRRVTGLAPGTV